MDVILVSSGNTPVLTNQWIYLIAEYSCDGQILHKNHDEAHGNTARLDKSRKFQGNYIYLTCIYLHAFLPYSQYW